MKYITLNADGSLYFQSTYEEENPNGYLLHSSNLFSHLNYKIETTEPTTLRRVLDNLDSMWYSRESGFNDNFMDTLSSIFGDKTLSRLDYKLAKPVGGAEEYVLIEELYYLHGDVLSRGIHASAMTKNGRVYLESSEIRCLLDIPLEIGPLSTLEYHDLENPFTFKSNITLYDFLDCILNKISVNNG